ncbi:delta(14)-sterol reductase TM7SF2 isoform X1 [Bemisia tabaci]|uniref:delta(14)-sterol reductase TM7SF2 isoform X1 n=2 Tax=Bemisia tabaci TaxID=7038 RepID=UPI003B284146
MYPGMDRNFRRSPARLANIAARKQSPARPKSPAKSKSPARSKSPSKPKSPAKSKSPSRSRPKSPARGKSPAKKSPARKASKSPARKPKSPTKAKSEPKPSPAKKPSKKKVLPEDDYSDSETSSVSVEPMKLDPKVEAVAAEVSQLPYRRSVRQVIKQIAASGEGKLDDGIKDEVKEILKANNVRTSSKSSSPKGYEVLFKALLYLIVFPAIVTLTHLSCTRAESCKLWPVRFPQTWRYFVNLESSLIFLGFVVWQIFLSILPVGKKVSGISESLEYRLSGNGLLSAFLTLSAIGGLRYFKFPVLSVLDRPMPLITTSYAVALLVSIVLFVKGGKAAKKSLNPKGNTGNKINDFIVGRELNPRIKSFDFKLFFKRHALLTALVYNALVALKLYETHKTLNTLPVTAVTIIALQTLFILDSLFFEDNFVTTFEAQVEGVGFRSVVYYTLYPFVFINLVKYLLISKVEKSPYVLGAIVVAQLIGYLIYRASNYQKNEFRKNPLNPRASALETIPTVQGRKLIVSGLWGKLQHPNYLGQLIIEWSWAFAADFKLWVPFVSAILLTITLIYRAVVVNAHNKSVYGTSWDRYTSRVKYSLIPKVF